MIVWCRCRNCGTKYDEFKSRADWKGYCSQACVHERARKFGYKKRNERLLGQSEYAILDRAKQLGSVPYDV